MSDEFQGTDVDQPAEQPAQAPQQPQYDPKALQEHVTTAVQQGLQQYRPQPQYVPVPQQQPQPDPLRDVLAPYLAPIAQFLNLKAELAADAAVFYPNRPEAAPFRQRIEEVVMDQANRGRPITREQAWSYLRGSELFDQLLEKTMKERQDAASRARNNTMLGPGLTRSPGQPMKSAIDATDEELENALKNVPF
jgi:hypothetical protein